jgi:cyclic dehypoxanthinyl futalosine synthase
MSLTKQQALEMFRSDDLIGIGMEADAVRRKLHPEGVVTYIIDRNINYTNFCTEYCTFCAFYRPLKGPAARKDTSSTSTLSTRRFARPWNSAARAC